MKLFVLFSCFITAAYAQVRSSTGLFNVSSPTPNAPYVASRVLPCVYTVSGDTNSNNLQLSISLNNGTKSIVINPSADISQGYSFQKNIGGVISYEHQFNYHIPINTKTGSYQVTFTDHVSETNLTIPITIGAAPPSSSIIIPSASGSSTPVHSSSAPTALKSNSASNTLHISKTFVFSALFLAIEYRNLQAMTMYAEFYREL
ncbi:hypothetical protein G6F61_008259 [Rhizopus arrhizus]|uniref:Uncharacterized protein n=1 Tax=Rhizopus oryzae TaxID=64495 RepID=A0A9P7BS79_RHIOR|nr:hypothetical protein G6F42_006814 [Rhizopus arrhizus]KAG1307727.1 hypothetical protein G6F64_006584 [Rhizopus arrhizus]KAG1375681.1 hypothetical protein G6F61_008259 [Rhizopus arrhizus]